jgi:hypothetical protein
MSKPHPIIENIRKLEDLRQRQAVGGSDHRLVRLVLPRPAWMQGGEDCDWHEDREHENGQYINKCCQCGSDFIGHKRRPACRRCYTQAKARYDAMTPEERADHDAKVAAEIAKLYETNDLGDSRRAGSPNREDG